MRPFVRTQISSRNAKIVTCAPYSFTLMVFNALMLTQGPELEGYYSTSVTGDRAIQVAQAHKEASADGSHLPLFMYLAFQVRLGCCLEVTGHWYFSCYMSLSEHGVVVRCN